MKAIIKKIFAAVFVFAVNSLPVLSYGQQMEDVQNSAPDFVRGDKIIFEDNFSTNTPDEVRLARWFSWPCKGKFGYLPRNYFDIEKTHEYALKIKSATEPVPVISPIVPGLTALPDTFTIEYDFLLDSPGASLSLCLDFSKQLGNCALHEFGITNDGDKGLLFTFHQASDKDGRITAKEQVEKVPCPRIYNFWRHFAFSYKNRAIKCFIDTTNVLSVADCGFRPLNYYQKFDGPVQMKYVVIAKGEGKNALFNKLYTEKKFTTHDILFDVNKSTIKEESMPFLTQLAEWLRKNPRVNIEIDGHTDSDGDEGANIKLSRERADEVKKQLASMGIYINRLTTRGYGSSKPIQSNATAEGKANNRRVEFIKL
jgi:OmpA-OmpF porin, OOP family